MVADADSPFFTTPHWNGYNAWASSSATSGESPWPKRAEVVTDAWLAKAPKRVAKALLEAVVMGNTPRGVWWLSIEEGGPWPDTPAAKRTT